MTTLASRTNNARIPFPASLHLAVVSVIIFLLAAIQPLSHLTRPAIAGGRLPLQTVDCEGRYYGHLQGVCTDGQSQLFWSYNTTLVCTNERGAVLRKATVANHHGDLCFVDGRLFVAVNLGEFNEPAGKADSWVYEYDAATLTEIGRHPVPEVVHGAGGVGFDGQRFLVVGGLPEGSRDNSLYEYSPDWKFVKRHPLKSGYTFRGIQTALFHDGMWLFGCYGKPKELVVTDQNLNIIGRQDFDCALGVVGVAAGELLVARPVKVKGAEMSSAQLIPVTLSPQGRVKPVKQD